MFNDDVNTMLLSANYRNSSKTNEDQQQDIYKKEKDFLDY